jgi:hypothetical protein
MTFSGLFSAFTERGVLSKEPKTKVKANMSIITLPFIKRSSPSLTKTSYSPMPVSIQEAPQL